MTERLQRLKSKRKHQNNRPPVLECADGSVITAGSAVVAQNWVVRITLGYMGEFDSRNDVISYLRSIGVSEKLINSKTVGDEKVQAESIGE